MRVRLVAAAAAALVSCSLTPVGAEWTSRVRLETAGYADSDHVSVVSPMVQGSVESPTRGIKFGGSYLVDVVSAASVDIVSTATKRWTEIRHAGTVSAGYKPHDIGLNANAYASVEPDYRSLGGGGTFVYDFNDRLHTFSFGYSFAEDVSGRSGTPFSVFSAVIDKHTISPGLTLTVDRATVLSLGLDLMFEKGDSSKPYRYVPFFASESAVPAGASVDTVNQARLSQRALEHLPLERDRYALSGRLLHRWEKVTLRLNERLYADNWGMSASTTDLRLPWDLSEHFRIYPHGRLHVQQGVSFWKHAYTLENGQWPTYWAGDRELGPLRTVTFGGGAQWELGRFIFTAQCDGMYTRFLDALYIVQRWGVLGSLGVEAVFE